MKKKFIIPVVLVLLSAALTAAGRLNAGFADWYQEHIFPEISTPYMILSGLLPFSLGEILIIAGILLVVIGIPLMIILLVVMKGSRRRVIEISLAISLWALAFVCTTEALNCFTLYGCTRFSEKYFTPAEHSREQLVELYSILIGECNRLSAQVPRDENDVFTLTIDADREAKLAMTALSEEYPQLSGYYPTAKPIMFSYFMSQSNLQGMYFPFSMESTYNDDMVRENLPETICHEYAHLKGFMQEDEANFISFLATTGSRSEQMQYGGYLEALEYVHNQIYGNAITEAYELSAGISQQVRNDWFRFMPENYWEDNESKEIISTETVSTVSSAASDTSMKMNGVEDGIESYSRVVLLLLDYYFPAEG
ncbi:MAG: DUF3810 domain-containing protein [Ruminococcus sp.]|nr:DUF3810 domain-containing protein [Ruminococcus sp.]